jgi:hypothetical protein
MNESENEHHEIPLAVRIPAKSGIGQLSAKINKLSRPPRERPPLNIRKAAVIFSLIGLGLIFLGMAVVYAYQSLSTANCTTLTTTQTELAPADGGFKLSVLPSAFSGEFGVQVSSLPPSAIVTTASQLTLRQSAEALPKNAKVVSGFYMLRLCKNEPKSLGLQISVAPNVVINPNLSYDLFTWDVTASRWRWLSSDFDASKKIAQVKLNKLPENIALIESAPGSPYFSVELPVGNENVLPQVQGGFKADGWQSRVIVSGLFLADFGNLAGDRSLVPTGKAYNKNVIVTVRNWSDQGEINRTVLRDMLASENLRKTHVANLINMLKASDYVGIEIDYRGVEESQREQFTSFINLLSQALSAETIKYSLNVVVPFSSILAGGSSGYDFRMLCETVEAVKLDTTAIMGAPLNTGQLEQTLKWLLGQVNRHKLQLIVQANSLVKENGSEIGIRIDNVVTNPLKQYHLSGLVVRSSNPKQIEDLAVAIKTVTDK